MRKVSELRKEAFDKFQQNYVNSIILSVICVLFIAGVVMVGLLMGGVSMILVMLVGLPFFFGCVMTHFSLQTQPTITGKYLFGSYIAYFRPPFFGCFRVIVSFFKTILYSLIVTAIVTGIVYLVFMQEAGFNDQIKELIEMYKTEHTAEEWRIFFETNNYQLYRFMCASMVPTTLFEYLLFADFIAKEQVNAYLRLNYPLVHPIVHKQAMKQLKKDNRKALFKYHYGLNWPLIVLMAIGGGIGSYVSYLMFEYNFSNMMTIGAVGMVLMMALYLPLYFHNQEAIYTEIKPLYPEYTGRVMTDLAQKAAEMRDRINSMSLNVPLPPEENKDVVDEQTPEEDNKDEIK